MASRRCAYVVTSRLAGSARALHGAHDPPDDRRRGRRRRREASRDVDGTLDLPESSDSQHDAAVLLLHGAGGDLHGGHLDGTAAAFANASPHPLPVVRVTMRSPRSPTPAMRARRPRVRQRHPALAGVSRWILAGHSNGARVAARLAAELRANPERGDRVLACALFSYPLHPPGKRDALRDAEILALPPECPLFFCVGEGDPFAEREVAFERSSTGFERGARGSSSTSSRGVGTRWARGRRERRRWRRCARRETPPSRSRRRRRRRRRRRGFGRREGRVESGSGSGSEGGKRRAREVEGEDGEGEDEGEKTGKIDREMAARQATRSRAKAAMKCIRNLSHRSRGSERRRHTCADD